MKHHRRLFNDSDNCSEGGEFSITSPPSEAWGSGAGMAAGQACCSWLLLRESIGSRKNGISGDVVQEGWIFQNQKF